MLEALGLFGVRSEAFSITWDFCLELGFRCWLLPRRLLPSYFLFFLTSLRVFLS